MLGDNPDALYYTAPVRSDRSYRVTGNLAGSVYLSFTVELGSADGGYSTETAGVLRDRDFDVAADGSFEVFFGGEPRDRNWLGLADRAVGADRPLLLRGGRAGRGGREPRRAARDRGARAGRSGAAVGRRRGGGRVPAGRRTSSAPARSSRPKPGERVQPTWVSETPNEFPQPELPGDFAFAAADAAYSMAPYVLGPDEALVMTGRWPECAFANVSVWNRYLQTYEYLHRPGGRNRANTTLEPDGSYRIVIAHEDPGVPNWIDTGGRPFGMVFWRFFLPEGEVERPVATVVKVADLRG